MKTRTATHSFEIEITLSGTLIPASGDGWNEPKDDGGVEDLDVTDIAGFRLGKNSEGYLRWTTHTLLNGVDRNSDAYQQIVRNILAFVGKDAETAILEAAE